MLFRSTNSDGAIFYFGGNTSSYAGLRIGYSTGFYILHSTNGTSWNVVSSAFSYPPYQWYHIAVTRNSSRAGTFYINGIPIYTFTWGTLYVGSLNYIGLLTNTTNYYYTGYISDVRINNTVLYTSNFVPPTSPAIPNLTYTNSNYLNGNVIAVNASSNVTANSVIQSSLLLSGSGGGIIDQARNADIMCYGNTYVTSANVPYTGSGLSSVYFNGSSYLQVQGTTPSNQEDSFLANNFTIETYANFSSVSTMQTIMDTRPYGTSAFTGGYCNLYMTATGTIVFNSNSSSITSGSSLTANTWYNIAVCRYSGNTKLFINGTQSGSTLADTGTYNAANNRPTIGVDGNTGGNNFMNGYLSDFRISKGVGRYAGNFTVQTAPLITQ